MACEKVEPRAKKETISNNHEIKQDRYILDGKGGLFQNVKWYTYDMQTHLIWPLYDVYVIKREELYFKVQIESYYDEHTQDAGVITLRINEQRLHFDASACGNPYANPDYANCLNDPNRNVYTYINLETMNLFQISDQDAELRADWDMAFKGTEVKLRRDRERKKSVVGAVLKRFDFFFSNGSPFIESLKNKDLQKKAIAEFSQLELNKENLNFYLPDGVDRVIFEEDLFKDLDATSRSINDDFGWIVKSHQLGAYFKLNFENLSERYENGNIYSEFMATFYTQKNRGEVFSENKESVTIIVDTTMKIISLCLNFLEKEVYTCERARPDWDIKFLGLNTYKDGVWKRDWKILTNKGAIGPLTKIEMREFNSGD